METGGTSRARLRSATLLFAAVVATLVLVFNRACFGRWWIEDRTPTADTYMLATIYERWAAQVREGRLPLWFSEFAAGSPVHAAWMYGLAYPPMLLFVVLPPEVAWTWLAILHVAFGAAGMFLFLKSEEHGDAAAITGAIVFSLSGFMLGRVGAGHLNLVIPLAWAPWVFLCTARCLRGARGGAAMLGICAATAVLSGHVQVWFYLAPLAAGFALVKVRSLGAGWREARQLALAVAFAAGIAAIQWVPTLELVRVGGMVNERPEVLAQGSATWQTLGAQICPRLFEDDASKFHHEFLGLAGPLAVGAAAMSVFQARRGRWLWLVALGLGIVLSIGTRSPLSGLLNSVPPIRFGRVPGRALVLVVFAAAPLAAIVVAARWTRARWLAPLVFAASGLASAPAVASVRSDFYDHDWESVIRPSARRGRVNVAGCRYPYLERFGVRTLRDVCPVGTPGWRTFLGDTAPAMSWWFDFGAQIDVPWNGRPPADGAAASALRSAARVDEFRAPGRAAFFRSAPRPESIDLVARIDHGERVLCVHASGDDDSCRGWGTLDASAPISEAPGSRPGAPEFDVDAPSAGWLFVSETWYPGWEASTDGASWAPAERVNLAFLAVAVDGPARVRLRYAPWWQIPVMLASGGSLAAAVLHGLVGRRPRA